MPLVLQADPAGTACWGRDGLARNADGPREARHAKPIVGQEVFPEHLAGMTRPSLHYSRYRGRSCHPSPLVVVAKLDVVGITIEEPKADSPLVVDRDRMLALPVPVQRVKPIAWRHLQVSSRVARSTYSSLRAARVAKSAGNRLARPVT